MLNIISTKILPKIHQEKLADNHIKLVSYNAIQIQEIPFNCPKTIENAIFTSRNAIEKVLKKGIAIKKAYIVGKKSEEWLIQKKINVICCRDYAKDLAKDITTFFADQSFYFFCGNLYRMELLKILAAHKIAVKKNIVYHTHLTPKKIPGKYEGCMFFSPSAVLSHTQYHKIAKQQAFCIGETTANSAKKFTSWVHIPTTPSITEVVDMVIEYKQNYD